MVINAIAGIREVIKSDEIFKAESQRGNMRDVQS
jgi:hypothetical protein